MLSAMKNLQHFKLGRLLDPVKNLCNRKNYCNLMPTYNLRRSEKQAIISHLRNHFGYRILMKQTKNLSNYSGIEFVSLDNKLLKHYLKYLGDQFEDAERAMLLNEDLDAETVRANHKKVVTLGPLVYSYRECIRRIEELKEYDKMIEELSIADDKETLSMAQLERSNLLEELLSLQGSLMELILPEDKADNFDVILEVNAGVGGQEAMLFTHDMFNMYERFASYKGWSFEVVDTDDNDMGGLRKASAVVSGEEVYKNLKFEAGVHRVQRVPKTEKSGRVHTSTMTVSVMAKPSEVDIILHNKDLKIDTYRASGAGGQHVNTTDSAVRVTHLPTKTIVECQVGRSQIKNREMALEILRARLYEKEVEEQRKARKSERKLQVGSGARSEKIRTYNFQQDRVTDHRISGNRFNIEEFLSGGMLLEELLEDLQTEADREQLQEMLEEFAEQQKEETNLQ